MSVSEDYKKNLSKDQRLLILQTLQQDSSYTVNSTILLITLEGFGHKISNAKIHTELTWLEEQGFISLEDISDTVSLAKITTAGADVAQGSSSSKGVARPQPE